MISTELDKWRHDKRAAMVCNSVAFNDALAMAHATPHDLFAQLIDVQGYNAIDVALWCISLQCGDHVFNSVTFHNGRKLTTLASDVTRACVAIFEREYQRALALTSDANYRATHLPR